MMIRRMMATILVTALAFALVPGIASAGGRGGDRPMMVWATNALHQIGPVTDPERCPALPGLVLLFQTFVGGTGHATHVGTYAFTGDHCTYLDPVSSAMTYAFGHWMLTAANGDTFSAPYMESTTPAPVDPSVDIVTVAAHEIEGGTGRFADASGWMECTLKMVITDPSTFTADMSGSCRGEIGY